MFIASYLFMRNDLDLSWYCCTEVSASYCSTHAMCCVKMYVWSTINDCSEAGSNSRPTRHQQFFPRDYLKECLRQSVFNSYHLFLLMLSVYFGYICSSWSNRNFHKLKVLKCRHWNYLKFDMTSKGMDR